MKKIFSILLATTMLSSAAVAGNINLPVIIDAAPVAATAAAASTDWSGLYVGGLASFDSGTRDYDNHGAEFNYVYEATTGYGGFAGYNLQNGSFVYGGELAFSSGGSYIAAFPTSSLESIMDVKARAGVSVGSALIYGVVGYSTSQWELFGPSIFSVSGLNFGAGMDYMVSDNLFVGFEYLTRDMSGPEANDPLDIGMTTVNSAELRAGWKF